jgi:hypothetical protein
MNEEHKQGRESRGQSQAVVLIESDHNIFEHLREHRFLRLEHLSALTGRSYKRLHKRVHELQEAGYLTVRDFPQQKHIYGLAAKALPVLVQERGADPEIVSTRIRTSELSEFFFNHEMMLVDIHVTLSLASQSHEIKLLEWREGPSLFDRVTVGGTGEELPFRPDAFFRLEDGRRAEGRNRASFFLEADWSAGENHNQFKKKLVAYWHFLEQGKHAEKFGVKTFRVLTVAKREERAKNLLKLVQETLPESAWKYFLFSSLNQFSMTNPGATFDAVHLSARGSPNTARVSLVPPVPPT